MNKKIITILGVILILIIIGGAYELLHRSELVTSSSSKIQIVAAENFYGDVAKQLGGDHVSVVSILSDPNVDPHEYESNVSDAVSVSRANIVIENGLEYDTWMDKLLSASPNKNRIVLVEGKIASNPLPDNPHVWYGVNNMPAIAKSITDSLKKIDPADASTFDHNLSAFDNSLYPLTQKMSDIKAKYNGVPVGLTETIYLYQTGPMGLNVLTPLEFERAIAEGNDPSVADVKKANDQVASKQIKVLIYNAQTVTPITTNLQNEAKANNISVVPVTETMPQNKTYQTWMMDQLNSLQKVLQQVVQ